MLLGVSISIFSVVVAVTNSTSRLIFTLGRERLLPPVATRLSKRHLTPVGGIGFMTVVSGATALFLVVSNNANVTIYGYLSSFGGYGAILAYLVVSLAIIGWLRNLHLLKAGHVLVSLGVGVSLVYVYYENLVPEQASPYNWLIYGFLGTVVVVMVAYGVMRASGSGTLKRVGTTVDDDTAHLPTGVDLGGHHRRSRSGGDAVVTASDLVFGSCCHETRRPARSATKRVAIRVSGRVGGDWRAALAT